MGCDKINKVMLNFRKNLDNSIWKQQGDREQIRSDKLGENPVFSKSPDSGFYNIIKLNKVPESDYKTFYYSVENPDPKRVKSGFSTKSKSKFLQFTSSTSCIMEGIEFSSLKPLQEYQKMTITFENKNTLTLNIIWLDRDGNNGLQQQMISAKYIRV